jgi:hypothetical protein
MKTIRHYVQGNKSDGHSQCHDNDDTRDVAGVNELDEDSGIRRNHDHIYDEEIYASTGT